MYAIMILDILLKNKYLNYGNDLVSEKGYFIDS